MNADVDPNDDVTPGDRPDMPDSSAGKKAARAGMQIAGGAIPFVGGFLTAAAGAWSEHDQDQVNKVFQQWLQMLEDELREKGRTIVEVMARLDVADEKIKERIESPEYQSVLKKGLPKLVQYRF